MNTPVNQFRYTTTNRLGVRNSQPLGEANFTIVWALQDEQKIGYKKTMPGKIVFRGEAYDQLLQIEKSIYRCEYTDILIERRCVDDGDVIFYPYFTGRISLNDGTWNLDRCELEIKVSQIDPEQCLEDHKNDEFNLFDEVTERRAIKLFPNGMTIEKKEFIFTTFTSFLPCTVPQWGDPGTPADGRWISYFHAYKKSTIFCVSLTKWARYAVTVGCADSAPGPEWLLVSTDCPGTGKKYVKEINIYDCEDTVLPDGTKQHECKIVGEGTDGWIDNGMELGLSLSAVVDKFCPGTPVVSDFFQINPDFPDTINYVTGVTSKTDKVVIFQKSDMKRPDAVNNATIAKWTFEKMINAICEMFNCRWTVDENGFFRVEHISYFQRNAGFDLTAPRYSKYMVGTRKYSYQTEKIPDREEYKFMEASAGDFAGLPIFYSGACVSDEGRDNVITHAAEDVTTDLELCFANADGDSSVVDDRGFAFVACREVEDIYYIITEPAILSADPKLNNSLAWAQLHRDYHKYYRPLKNGVMNDVDTEFLSVRPTKKGETITIPLCCEDLFQPGQTVKTFLGDGIVDNAKYNFKGSTLELDLLYPVTYEENEPPVAVNDVVSTPKNTPLTIIVLANDTDADGDAIIAVQIMGGPAHGTAVVNSSFEIEYTPETNYTGPDQILYRIQDSYGNWSNLGLIVITVTVPALTLVLVNDNYETEVDTVLNEPAVTGLLANDTTSAGPLTCTAETKPTNEGGTIQIFADGSFTYTPPLGDTVEDFFDYTATNGTDTDTARCYVSVFTEGGRHLIPGNYEIIEGPILGFCSADISIDRSPGAVTDATAAIERVKITIKVYNDAGCPPFFIDYIFEPTDSSVSLGVVEVCNIAPGCSLIITEIVSLVIEP